jgi:hypothetical protein
MELSSAGDLPTEGATVAASSQRHVSMKESVRLVSKSDSGSDKGWSGSGWEMLDRTVRTDRANE